jgi:hypothetical protein
VLPAPLRILGSTHVDFGGIILFVSAIHFKCSIVTGNKPNATAYLPSSTCFFNSLLPFIPGTKPMRLSVFKSCISKIGANNSSVNKAASIIAKFYRDSLMINYSKNYPNFNFDKNFGYYSEDHVKIIEKYGFSDLHRKSYKIKKLAHLY